MRPTRPARFIGGPLDGWHNVGGGAWEVRQDGPDHVVRYFRCGQVWHDEQAEVLSHLEYRFAERREGRLR